MLFVPKDICIKFFSSPLLLLWISNLSQVFMSILCKPSQHSSDQSWINFITSFLFASALSMVTMSLQLPCTEKIKIVQECTRLLYSFRLTNIKVAGTCIVGVGRSKYLTILWELLCGKSKKFIVLFLTSHWSNFPLIVVDGFHKDTLLLAAQLLPTVISG